MNLAKERGDITLVINSSQSRKPDKGELTTKEICQN
jgi:hypothetical protein